jgi:hypothetical protein
MRRFTVEEARERFGDLVDELKLGRPFGEGDDGSFFIEQDGKPVGMVLARESLLQVFDQQEEWMRDAVAKGMADHEAGRYVELVTDQDWYDFAEGIKRRGRERLEREGRACPDAAE